MDSHQVALALKYGKEYGVDPKVLLAIAGHETQWGTKGAGREGYTLGYGVTDSGILNQYQGVENQYRYAAKTLSGWGVHSIKDILAGKASAYATDPHWEKGVADVYGSLGGKVKTLPYTGQDPGFEPLPVQKDLHPEIHNLLDRVANPDLHYGGQEGLLALAQGRYNPTEQLANLLTARQTPALVGESPSGSTAAPIPPVPTGPETTLPTTTKGKSRGGLAEAFYDPLGQWDNGRFSKQGIGGHSDHVHLSITNPQSMLSAIKKAQQLGLHVGENPYVGDVNPVHVKGSFHYRVFPGEYNGKKLGEAIDVSGDPKLMSAFFRWALANLR